MSPELLDGPSQRNPGRAQRLRRQARLGQPKFVGVIDDSHDQAAALAAAAPGPDTNFGGSHSGPRDLAVDETNGAVYVVERMPGASPATTPKASPYPFTAGPGAGTNKIGGLGTGGGTETTIARRQRRRAHRSKATSTPGKIPRRSMSTPAPAHSSGELTGFYEACGARGRPGHRRRLRRRLQLRRGSGNSTRSPTPRPVTNANYEETTIHTQGMNPCQVAAGGGRRLRVAVEPGPAAALPDVANSRRAARNCWASR